MAITLWTDPRDWATDEMVTELMMDTHVRDNLKHLYEKTQLKVYSNNEDTEDQTGEATMQVSSCTVSVVVDYVSDIYVWCTSVLWHEDQADITCWMQPMRDSTPIGIKVAHYIGSGDGVASHGKTRSQVSNTVVDESVAIGTYTYAVGFMPNGGSGQANIEDKRLLILVIPQHG